MGRTMVLGDGWLGSAITAQAGIDRQTVSIDPLLVPELGTRDLAASRLLASLVADSATTTVVNACGLTKGTREQLEDANAGFPRWLCETLSGLGVRLVHIGSASEYGDPGSGAPIPETAPCAPVGDYAETKACGSQIVLEAREAGLDAVVARVFNIVDRDMPPSSPVRQWLDALGALPPAGGEIDVWWPATRRDFVTRSDAARALVELSGAGPRPAVVNVCSGVGLAYGEIVEALAGALDVRATVRSLHRPGIETVIGDPSTLRDLLGWAPTMSLEVVAATVVSTGACRPAT